MWQGGFLLKIGNLMRCIVRSNALVLRSDTAGGVVVGQGSAIHHPCPRQGRPRKFPRSCPPSPESRPSAASHALFVINRFGNEIIANLDGSLRLTPLAHCRAEETTPPFMESAIDVRESEKELIRASRSRFGCRQCKGTYVASQELSSLNANYNKLDVASAITHGQSAVHV